MGEKKYDVTIVGAGPAGCSAAFFLAKNGFKVLLADKATFPRDKICGDGISSASLNILEEMEVLKKIEAIEHHKINYIKISSPNGRMMTGRYPIVKNFRDYGYVVKRKEFDHVLFEHVKALSNVHILENFRVDNLVYNSGKVTGVSGSHGDEKIDIFSDYIIGADGVHSKIAKKIGLFNDKNKHRAFAVRGYFEDVQDLSDAVEIHYDSQVVPGYCWIFPTGKTSANVGVGVFNRFTETRETKELFDLFIRNNKFAKRRLKNAEMKGPLKGFPLTLGSFGSRRSRGNVLLIGDAASFIDPLTGEGIYYALLSGKFAAEAIRQGVTSQTAGEIYEKMWSGKFKNREFMPGYLLQTLMGSRIAINTAVFLGSISKKKATSMAGVISHVLPKYRMIW
jgi:geranylgeranyl reductase family protein